MLDKPWIRKLILTRDTMQNLDCSYREATKEVQNILKIYNAEV